MIAPHSLSARPGTIRGPAGEHRLHRRGSPLRTVSLIVLLSPFTPAHGQTIRPDFDWSMERRFKVLQDQDGFTHYDYSRCYLLPESSRYGQPCHGWKVTFSAHPTTGDHPPFGYEWTIPGERVCDPEIAVGGSKPIDPTNPILYGWPMMITCTFKKLGKYPVTLSVRDERGNVDSVRREINLRDFLIVSIGNSIASGEGNPNRPALEVFCNLVPAGNCTAKMQEAGATQWQIARSHCYGTGGPSLTRRFCIVPAQWADQRCHRSMWAGPAVAAAAIEHNDPHSSVTFLHLACSGASIVRGGGLLTPYEGLDPGAPTAAGLTLLGDNTLPPQLDEVARLLCPEAFDDQARRCFNASNGDSVPLRQIDALLIEIGANDLNFGNAATACAVLPHCGQIADGTLIIGLGEVIPNTVRAFLDAVKIVKGLLDTLPSRLQQLNDAIKRELNVQPKNVFLTEYFDPTHDETGSFCHMLKGTEDYAEDIQGWFRVQGAEALTALTFDGITTDESRWAFDSVLVPMNQRLKNAATLFGWNYVGGVQQAFLHHGTCSSDHWVHNFKSSKRVQNDIRGVLHPNLNGHVAYQTQLQTAMEKAFVEPAQPMLVRFSGLRQLDDMAQPVRTAMHQLNVHHNQPPIATAGANRTARLGSSVKVDGGHSRDPDHFPGPLTYSWAQLGGPAAVITPFGIAEPMIVFTPRIEGSYTFRLIVNDGLELSSPDTVTITVPLLGDIDGDGDVDSDDIRLLQASVSRPANGPNDIRDLNADGRITITDTSELARLCTRPGCSTN